MIDHCLKSHLFALPVCNVDVVDDVVVLPIFARLLVGTALRRTLKSDH